MAGAIAFNVLIAFIPLALVLIGIAGTLLQARVGGNAPGVLLTYILSSIPPVSGEFAGRIEKFATDFIDQSTSLLSIGTIFLLWFAARLVGTLRSVLREIFDVQRDRGIVGGKLFDMKMVIAAGTLFAVNVGITFVLGTLREFGTAFLEPGGWLSRLVQVWYGPLIALATIWVMFLLIYRYLPARRIGWGTALVAATFTALLFELMKVGFGWYVTNVAEYRSTYNNLTTVAILFFWIYYSAVVFVLGGEVAQVTAMQRVRRHQKERLEGG